MQVRAAVAADVPVVRSVAAAAWQHTYAGLLRPATIDSFIERAYSTERVLRRIEADIFLVAIEAGSIVAFCDALEREAQVDLLAIYARPDRRGHGAGSALLGELRSRFPERTIVAEVLVGNRSGEVFYERRGFEPSETVETELFGEPVIERRWRLAPPPRD